ncbi:MAG: hypothetical protein PHG64_14330 [Paludibacter sp.]|nr:hypothetical protein [Paludibacter sp.]
MEIEIKTPMELFLFVDKFFERMSDDDIAKLMQSVLGRSWTVTFGNDVEGYKNNKADLKLELGAIFMDDFNKNDIHVLIPPSAFLNDKLMEPLNRPITPDQLDYIRWLRSCKEGLSFSNMVKNEAEFPDHIKKYLMVDGSIR